jgi:soluble lytic murein transglycosylase-like protein
MLHRSILLLFCAALACPGDAEAQLYAWRDAAGNLVISDRKLDPGAATFGVPHSTTVRSTRPAPASSARFEPLVVEHAGRQGLRPDLVRAVIQVESGFDADATSPKGAMGLMQLMPATARELGVRDPYDPAENIRGGTTYLRQLLDRYDGDEELALAAYNAGFGAVDRHGGRVPPFRETQDYVRKVESVTSVQRDAPPGPTRLVIYKTVEMIEGQLVPRYSSYPPSSGPYETIER